MDGRVAERSKIAYVPGPSVGRKGAGVFAANSHGVAQIGRSRFLSLLARNHTPPFILSGWPKSARSGIDTVVGGKGALGSEAHLINVAVGIHADDPAFGYRFI